VSSSFGTTVAITRSRLFERPVRAVNVLTLGYPERREQLAQQPTDVVAFRPRPVEENR
jgi:hypothetical protein